MEFRREMTGMAARDGGWSKFLKFLLRKNFEAGKWHGCHFPAAQGIEAEIPEAPAIWRPAPNCRAEELERKARSPACGVPQAGDAP
jgi:hypothetical protein